ncbi:DUF6416 domain-containing protein [Nocardioides sp.]|uniref:DUF6416 domain-containing protein n=1 Tax=Nocardioides sp. TaxID=35761 RepID=UPI003785256A
MEVWSKRTLLAGGTCSGGFYKSRYTLGRVGDLALPGLSLEALDLFQRQSNVHVAEAKSLRNLTKENILTDITVPVPDDRTAEFYQFFGLWLAGSLDISQGISGAPESPSKAPTINYEDLPKWGHGDDDFDIAVTLWKKYSPNARKMFSLLIDNPDKEYTGDEIAEAIGLANGAHGVAGVLAWPGRYGYKVGRRLPNDWREDADTLQSYYWMPAERAEMFKEVRAQVEGA